MDLTKSSWVSPDLVIILFDLAKICVFCQSGQVAWVLEKEINHSTHRSVLGNGDPLSTSETSDQAIDELVMSD